MPDYLTVTYPAMSSTYLPPGDYGCTPGTYPLSARTSVSSTGTLPGLASASDSDDVSPPLSPIRTSPELGRPSPQVVRSSSQSRPSLRHMPSWASFISHRSSKTTTSAGASSDVEDDIDAEYLDGTRVGVDIGDPVYADAVDEHGVLIPFKKISRERETSSKSSRKLRSGLSVFKRFATLRHRPQPLPSLSSFPSLINFEDSENFKTKTKSKLEYNDSLRILDIGKPGFKWYADTNTNTNTDRESNRIDTPLTMPSLKLSLRPQLESRLATMAEVSPPLTSPEGDDERDQDDAADEFFTPLPIHSAVLPAIAKLGNSTHFPPPPGRRRFVSARKTQQLSKDAMQDAEPELDPSLTFDLDIFSPRAPAAPILLGVMGTPPISPLTLPAPGPGISALLNDATHVSILLPSEAPISPRAVTFEDDDRSTKQTLPSRDTRGSIVSLYTALSSSPVQPSTSPSPPRTDLQSRPGSVRFATGPRRLSAIMRPPIRPTPTPPSLLASPRALGTPRLPSVTNLSPTPPKYKTSPTPPKYKKGVSTLCHIPYASEPESVLETIKNRRASRMSLISPSGSLRLCALGFEPSEEDGKAAGKSEGEDGRTHVATPGTFGMQGEAERRLVLEGVNPYFA